MNKNMIFAGIIIALIVYWLIGFVNSLEDEVNVSHGFEEKALITNNSNDMLLLSTLSVKEKKRLWNDSNLKTEMIALFPHFIEMKTFVEEYVEDDGRFKQQILSNIEDVEFEYVGGGLSGEKAKAKLLDF